MIPSVVLSTVEKHLNGGHVRQVNKRGDYENVLYEFELQEGEKRHKLLIEADGELLPEEK